MITYDANPSMRKDGSYEFSFSGLSTDEKPVENFRSMPIANGADFMEIDTQTLFFYDAEGKQWK